MLWKVAENYTGYFLQKKVKLSEKREQIESERDKVREKEINWPKEKIYFW